MLYTLKPTRKHNLEDCKGIILIIHCVIFVVYMYIYTLHNSINHSIYIYNI